MSNTCTIERIHHQFKFEYNKLNSNHKPDLPPAFIDDLWYQAMLDYIDMFYSSNNSKFLKYGFEQTQQRIDMLAPFVVDVEISDLKQTQQFNVLKYNLDLPKDYIYHVRSVANTDCGDSKVNINQHDDISSKLAYKKPDPKWNNILGTISKGTDNYYQLVLYSTREVNKVFLKYIKIPNKPFFGGYDTLEYINGDTSCPNKNTNKINPELPINICNIITRIAIINMSDILRDYNNSNQFNNKLLINN